MIKEGDIDRFYDFIKTKNVKKLNAQIQKATGYGKSTISTYMNRVKEPSEEFIKAVYGMFNESSITVPHEISTGDRILEASAVKVTLNDYIELLKEKAEMEKKEKQFAQELLSQKVSSVEEVLVAIKELLSSRTFDPASSSFEEEDEDFGGAIGRIGLDKSKTGSVKSSGSRKNKVKG